MSKMFQKVVDYITEEVEKKTPVYIENYIYQKELVDKRIHPVLKSSSIRDAIIDFTGAFINAHHKELSTSGPVHAFMFGDKETNFLYDIFEITKEDVLDLFKQVTEKTYGGKLSLPLVGLIKKAPHKILITSIMVDALQSNYNDIVNCCEYLMGFADYPMVFRSSWKLGVNESIMAYTIEHLPNKFKIKAKGITNLLGLIYYDMSNVKRLCAPHLTKGADNSYIDYIYRVRNQMKNTYQKIAEQYYANQKNNKLQYTTSDMNDEGMMLDQEGISSNITAITDNTVTKFIKGDINTEFLKTIAEIKKEVSYPILLGYISKILSAKDNRLHEFIEGIVTQFFLKTGATEITAEFLNFSLKLYNSINRSIEPAFENLAKIVKHWSSGICQMEKDYSRSATLINYRIAIYQYFVMMINYYN